MVKNVVKEIDSKGNKTRLLVKGTNATFMNALRRTIMVDVPTFAIDELSIYDNSGVMFDEFLAQRIGLVPLKTDSDAYKEGEKVKLVLEASGPGTVYSKQIKSTDPKVEVVEKNVPLAKLKKDQRVRMEMDAVMGTGKTHAKWQPAIVSYKNVPELHIHKDRTEWESVAKVCPPKVLSVKAKKLVLEDPLGCTMCGACMDYCKDNEIAITPDEASFVFYIESFGGMENKEIVSRAFDVLIEKCRAFSKEVAE
ncbi:MAG: DNA-directed RNA polymerase subunit D [Candidatus Diapherotrites archaeon]|nr:DNA-directed RNA polymerase subunit D [Candidatus Diapherotrites archaeon]